MRFAGRCYVGFCVTVVTALVAGMVYEAIYKQAERTVRAAAQSRDVDR